MLHKYLPNSNQENELKDRLARDLENDTIRNFLILINEIKQFPIVSNIPDKLLNKDFSNLNDQEIKEIIQKSPAFEEQLEYYIRNKTSIESLKKYLEASTKVGEVANDFFKKK